MSVTSRKGLETSVEATSIHPGSAGVFARPLGVGILRSVCARLMSPTTQVYGDVLVVGGICRIEDAGAVPIFDCISGYVTDHANPSWNGWFPCDEQDYLYIKVFAIVTSRVRLFARFEKE